MKKLLVLAYSDEDDFPENSLNYDEIIAFGHLEQNLNIKNLKTFNKFFEIKSLEYAKGYFQDCFAKHPDPWGEPRNWLQAFSAISVAVEKSVKFEFWFLSEIIATHFLLNHSSPSTEFEFIGAKPTDQIKGFDNFVAEWKVNGSSEYDRTLQYYKDSRTKILQDYYQTMGKYFTDDIDLQTVLRVVKELNSKLK